MRIYCQHQHGSCGSSGEAHHKTGVGLREVDACRVEIRPLVCCAEQHRGGQGHRGLS